MSYEKEYLLPGEEIHMGTFIDFVEIIIKDFK